MAGHFDLKQFHGYFRERYDRAPFPWQSRLAERVFDQPWPDVIDLPTASGKTACLDIALFALAFGKGPRRIFFVVNRKVIVDQAFARARETAEKLRNAQSGILREMADALREIAGGDDPLLVHELRGGIFRDESWMRDPLQPVIVSSTVDQVGSRLLFRGYGLREYVQPMHAGLISHDSLVLLDEAHCSTAFVSTLGRIKHYRDLGERVGEPFQFVEMTATPAQGSPQSVFQLDEDDRKNDVLSTRLLGKKPTRWVATKAKSADSAKLGTELARLALEMGKRSGMQRIAVIANRVETARAAARELVGQDVTLVVGRMRPVDREIVEASLRPLETGRARTPDAAPRFVVATQCLEVGADLDFDALVTELASMDALLQRFGRLNRVGDLPEGGYGCVVAPAPDLKRSDAIYGEALTATREWLEPLFAGDVEREFAIEGEGSIPLLWRELTAEAKGKMLPERPVCPALLPAHLDTLAQTSPRPVPEPAVEYFLHGRQAGAADVHVVWRADLSEEHSSEWGTRVAAFPPVIREAMPVKLWVFRAWMKGKVEGASTGDVEWERDPDEVRERGRGETKAVFVWSGGDRKIVRDPGLIRPGDTIVLPASEWPIPEFGHFPDGRLPDVAEEAAWMGRGKARMRLQAEVWAAWGWNPDGVAAACANDALASEDAKALVARRGSDTLGDLAERILNSKFKLRLEKYPGGWVIESRESNAEDKDRAPDTLRAHTKAVGAVAANFAEKLKLPSLEATALWHDSGKVDLRFQTLLFGGDSLAAELAREPRAKGTWRRRGVEPESADLSNVPEGFRHELLSLQLARKAGVSDPVTLHLIASHHGRCRPFAPVVIDEKAEEVVHNGVALSRAEREETMAHRLDSGVAERFWQLTRCYGWWGLAYLEAVFRLADWEATVRGGLGEEDE